ncbi:hypothetical protein K6L09_21050 [Burkholderia cepacia]
MRAVIAQFEAENIKPTPLKIARMLVVDKSKIVRLLQKDEERKIENGKKRIANLIRKEEEEAKLKKIEEAQTTTPIGGFVRLRKYLDGKRQARIIQALSQYDTDTLPLSSIYQLPIDGIEELPIKTLRHILNTSGLHYKKL